MVSTGVPALDKLFPGGYPERSAIVLEGLSSNEKEELGYRFIESGLDHGDFCLYVTRLSSSAVIGDAKASGIDLDRGTFWMCPEKGDMSYEPDDLASISFAVKRVLKDHSGRRTRVAFDLPSQLLMSNSPDPVYRFLGQLLGELKKYDATVLSTVQEDMHQPQVLAGLELLFDGVLGVRRSSETEVEVRVKKMLGIKPMASTVQVQIGGSVKGETSGHLTKQRIAVLPFANMSPDPNDEYLADGFTEELISAISKISGLDVISRTSVMQYKKSSKSVREISDELKVGTILEGSARKAGNKMRVTVQVIDPEFDRHLWAESYDRDLQDIFAIQSDISRKVADALRVKVLFQERERIERKPTENEVAHLHYLKGRYFWNQRTKDGNEKAVKQFEEAIRVDPKFGLAFAGLADCQIFGVDAGWLNAHQAIPEARRCALNAIGLDPALAEPYASLGMIYGTYEYDWRQAEDAFNKSIELKPSNATAHQWYSLMLRITDNLERAYAEIRLAEALDPLSQAIGTNLAEIMREMGRPQQAIEQLRRVIQLNPEHANPHFFLAWAYYSMSRTEEAIAELRLAVRLSGGDPFYEAELACILGFAGRKEEATDITARLERLSQSAYVDKVVVAAALFGIGRDDEGFSLLEKGYGERSTTLLYLRGAPWFAHLRYDPRWISIESRLGFR